MVVSEVLLSEVTVEMMGMVVTGVGEDDEE